MLITEIAVTQAVLIHALHTPANAYQLYVCRLNITGNYIDDKADCFMCCLSAGSNYYVRILSTIDRELLKPSASVALHKHSNALVDVLPPEADSSITMLSAGMHYIFLSSVFYFHLLLETCDKCKVLAQFCR